MERTIVSLQPVDRKFQAEIIMTRSTVRKLCCPAPEQKFSETGIFCAYEIRRNLW